MGDGDRAEEDRPDLAATAKATSRPAELDATLADTASDAAPRDDHGLPRGTTVGRYLVLDVLGVGGMGVVYAAYDPQLDRKIALKLVRDVHHPDARARMLREAQAIARLSHPNVVAVYDVGSHTDQQVFVAMELVEGDTLARWLQRRARTTAEIVGVFLQAGQGLAAAHRANLVHRDFKPDNVLIGRDGRARVLDFGLVREVEREQPFETIPDARQRPSDPMLSAALTQVGAIMGTPYYMAPEQFVRGATDARTDQYSFCVSLYEALSGQRPFEGTSFTQISDKVLTGQVPELQPIQTVSAHVRAAIRRGMSVDPAARFPGMEALLAELARDPRSRRRRWLVGAALFGTAGLALVVPLLARGSSERRPPCDGAGEQLAHVWNPSQKEAIERAFAATGVPYAATAAAAVGRRLDAYADAWRRTYAESCRSTHVRGEQSQELLDLRTACLQERRIELTTFSEMLTHADAKLVKRAHIAAQALSAVADCDDLVALQAPVKLPSDPSVRQAIASLRDELARLRAVASAKRPEARAPGEALLARARAVAFRPVEAEIGVLVGSLQSYADDNAAARSTLLDAFVAATASRHDLFAMEAATALVGAAADAEEFTRGHDWLSVADALVDRLGGSPLHRAKSRSIAGYLLSAEGKHAEAARAYEEALAIHERVAPSSHGYSVTLTGLAYAYDELGRYVEARSAGERSLAIQSAELGPMHPEIATVLLNLGNIADDEGDPRSATAYYERALTIREQAGEAPAGLANVINNLGVVAQGQERYAEALAYHERALALREGAAAGGGDVAVSLVNIGEVTYRLGRTEAALATYQRALTIAESRLGPEHPVVGDALLGIGLCRLAQQDAGGALPLLERALAIRRNGARPVELADVEIALARASWDRGQRDKALELALAARVRVTGDRAGKRTHADIERWLSAHGSPTK